MTVQLCISCWDEHSVVITIGWHPQVGCDVVLRPQLVLGAKMDQGNKITWQISSRPGNICFLFQCFFPSSSKVLVSYSVNCSLSSNWHWSESLWVRFALRDGHLLFLNSNSWITAGLPTTTMPKSLGSPSRFVLMPRFHLCGTFNLLMSSIMQTIFMD